ncbi:MAG: hypothetical protein IJY67_09110 [Paludibacteraceae bacterium]|nr:hypothetical protein [Paludibacteraceae bacterium]
MTNIASFTFHVTQIQSYKRGKLLKSQNTDFKIHSLQNAQYNQIQLLGYYDINITQNFKLPISNDPFDPDEIEDRFVYGRLTPFHLASPITNTNEYLIPIVMEKFKTKSMIRFCLPTLEQIECYGFYE